MNWESGSSAASADGNAANRLTLLDHALAAIEFNLDGTIRKANDNFLNALGYRLDEIVGEHHRMFVHREDQGAAYDGFWQALRAG